MTINNELKRLGMSQKSLAVLSGIPETRIRSYCKGRKDFTDIDRQILSKVIGVDTSTLTQPRNINETYYKVASSIGSNYSAEVFTTLAKAKDYIQDKTDRYNLITKVTFHGLVEDGIMMKQEHTQEVVEIIG